MLASEVFICLSVSLVIKVPLKSTTLRFSSDDSSTKAVFVQV